MHVADTTVAVPVRYAQFPTPDPTRQNCRVASGGVNLTLDLEERVIRLSAGIVCTGTQEVLDSQPSCV